MLDEEHDDVVDRLAGFNERRCGVQQPNDPGNTGDDNLLEDEGLDLLHHHRLQVADLFLDVLPQSCGTFGDEDLEDLRRSLQCLDHFFAQDFYRARTDIGVGESQNLQNQTQNPRQVEVVRQSDADFGHGAEQPFHESLFQVLENVIGKIVETQFAGINQVAKECDGIGNDQINGSSGPREHVQQHVLEVDDGLNDAFDRVLGRIHQAAVFRFNLLDAGIDLSQIVVVLLGQRIH